MSLSQIKSALIQQVVSSGIVPAAAITTENATFSPPQSLWALLEFVPASSVVATLGPTGTDRHTGFLQVHLNTVLNKGTAEIDAAVDQLKNLFTAGARFTYFGQQVVISGTGSSPGGQVNNFYRITLAVYFYADTIRQP